MKNFIWNIKCMLSAKKYRKQHESMEREYQWYKYLVMYDISHFFARFRFKSTKGEIPF